MNIYEINKAIEDILEDGFSVDEETGEILFDESDLNALNAEISEKIENVACYIKNLTADISALKEEERNLNTRRKQKERKIDSLKGYINYAMELSGRKSLESPRCKVSYRKSSSVEVPDINALDKDYVTETIEIKPNKVAIKEALKEGKTVEGAEIVERQNLLIK